MHQNTEAPRLTGLQMLPRHSRTESTHPGSTRVIRVSITCLCTYIGLWCCFSEARVGLNRPDEGDTTPKSDDTP
jgi:hypothetical protein